MGTLGDAVVRTEPFAVSQTVQSGLIFKITSNACTVVTTVADVPYAVALETFQDSAGTARTTAAGDRLPVALMGSGEIVQMQSITAQTYAKGTKVYAPQTASADGQVETSSANSAVGVGHYVGPGVTTSAAGELILVELDVPMGG